MEEKTWNKMWVAICLAVLILPLVFTLWYTPYEISHDEHMVETVNERALEYVPANQTVTDFAIEEILDNDAQLEYEERVWKLENQELYWIGSIVRGVIYGLMFLCLTIGIKAILGTNPFDDWDDDDEGWEDDDECLPMDGSDEELVKP